MQKALKNVPDERLRAHIIWLPMFPGDSRSWATTRSDEFTDKRLSYYWDGEKLTGKEWQKVLGTKGVAWDIYLIYGAESKWDKELPTPDFWMHRPQPGLSRHRFLFRLPASAPAVCAGHSLRHTEKPQVAADKLMGSDDSDARSHCVPVSNRLPPDCIEKG
jgi:hypothetical protein